MTKGGQYLTVALWALGIISLCHGASYREGFRHGDALLSYNIDCPNLGDFPYQGDHTLPVGDACGGPSPMLARLENHGTSEFPAQEAKGFWSKECLPHADTNDATKVAWTDFTSSIPAIPAGSTMDVTDLFTHGFGTSSESYFENHECWTGCLMFGVRIAGANAEPYKVVLAIETRWKSSVCNVPANFQLSATPVSTGGITVNPISGAHEYTIPLSQVISDLTVRTDVNVPTLPVTSPNQHAVFVYLRADSQPNHEVYNSHHGCHTVEPSIYDEEGTTITFLSGVSPTLPFSMTSTQLDGVNIRITADKCHICGPAQVILHFDALHMSEDTIPCDNFVKIPVNIECSQAQKDRVVTQVIPNVIQQGMEAVFRTCRNGLQEPMRLHYLNVLTNASWSPIHTVSDDLHYFMRAKLAKGLFIDEHGASGDASTLCSDALTEDYRREEGPYGFEAVEYADGTKTLDATCISKLTTIVEAATSSSYTGTGGPPDMNLINDIIQSCPAGLRLVKVVTWFRDVMYPLLQSGADQKTWDWMKTVMEIGNPTDLVCPHRNFWAIMTQHAVLGYKYEYVEVMLMYQDTYLRGIDRNQHKTGSICPWPHDKQQLDLATCAYKRLAQKMETPWRLEVSKDVRQMLQTHQANANQALVQAVQSTYTSITGSPPPPGFTDFFYQCPPPDPFMPYRVPSVIYKLENNLVHMAMRSLYGEPSFCMHPVGMMRCDSCN